jgi:hypothetical protein
MEIGFLHLLRAGTSDDAIVMEMTMGTPLDGELIRKMDAYWRAANYLSVGQIYLYDNDAILMSPAAKRSPYQLRKRSHGTVYNNGGSLNGEQGAMTTVDFEPLSVAVPLREEPPGVFRVGKSRVVLELVIHAFKAGATPEAIVQSYDTLSLADVYAVVTRYLADPAPIENYLKKCDEAAEETRRKIEAIQGPQGNLREVLLARAKAKGLLSDQARQ